MRVAVIGGGWYGCHLAIRLIRAGIDVELFEQSDALLGAAAKNNQLRLHTGFHYLRSSKTRLESLKGYYRFLSDYPTFSRPIDRNFYAVPENETLIDADTVRVVLSASQIPFCDVSEDRRSLGEALEASFLSEERLILVDNARKFFTHELGGKVHYGEHVDSPQRLTADFDWVIDSTYLSIASQPGVIHEATLLGEFDSHYDLPFGALTLIDGPLWSIYPTETLDRYSLSHVAFSPLLQADNRADIDSFLDSPNLKNHAEKALAEMRTHVLRYAPYLKDQLDTLRIRFITRKVKTQKTSASREVLVSSYGRVISVRQGKIDAIFEAERAVFEVLNVK